MDASIEASIFVGGHDYLSLHCPPLNPLHQKLLHDTKRMMSGMMFITLAAMRRLIVKLRVESFDIKINEVLESTRADAAE